MKQAEKIYMISDAAKQVKVESHVLRYWEEELQLPIKRNEMGHRYYTGEDIERFKDIKGLKEQGLQLRAIRSMLKGDGILNPIFTVSEEKHREPEKRQEERRREAEAEKRQEEITAKGRTEPEKRQETEPAKRQIVMVNKGEFVPLHEESREAKSLRLQQLLQAMIGEAVKSNNQAMCQELKESLVKELDYQFRLQEEKEEERDEERKARQENHYKEIDELIRSRNQKETQALGFKGLFARKKKPV